MNDFFEVYTDGACSNNQGHGRQLGGWAAVFTDGRKFSGSDSLATNNTMEMTAVIEALKNTPEGSNVKIYSDSAYIINCFLQNWIGNWEKNGWKTSQKKPVENKELWQEMKSLANKRRVEWIKVKGHSGNPLNEEADRLAVQAIIDFKSRKNLTTEAPTTLQEPQIHISLTASEVKGLLKELEKFPGEYIGILSKKLEASL